MNNHSDSIKLLAAYSGGDLEPAEKSRVEGHLAECSACRAELADLQISLRLIRSTPELEPPPWLAVRIMARVRERQKEKQSWLQRIFLPLHIKLPFEVAALLLVCVSGYYMARTVETELQQPVARPESPPLNSKNEKAADLLRASPPAAVSSVPAPQAGAAGKERGSETDISFPPATPEAADQITSRQMKKDHGVSTSAPAFAPAPPVSRDERIREPLESRLESGEPFKVVTKQESSRQARSPATEMKSKALGRSEQEVSDSEAMQHASGGAAIAALPQIRIRLNLTTTALAPETLKGAVTRAGGFVAENNSVQPRTLKARIPSQRLGDLLEQLSRLGKLVERPQAQDVSGMVLVEIIW